MVSNPYISRAPVRHTGCKMERGRRSEAAGVAFHSVWDGMHLPTSDTAPRQTRPPQALLRAYATSRLCGIAFLATRAAHVAAIRRVLSARAELLSSQPSPASTPFDARPGASYTQSSPGSDNPTKTPACHEKGRIPIGCDAPGWQRSAPCPACVKDHGQTG